MASKKKAQVAPTLTFPRTLEDVKREVREEYNEALRIFHDLRVQAIELLKNNFKLVGGCDCCQGRGWVVTWDTMDSLSGCYAEYGTCPECTPEQCARTGVNLGVERNPYDYNRGVMISQLRAQSPIWTALVSPYEAILADFETKFRELDAAAKPTKGSRVVIKRGRNDIGKVGVVAYIKGGEWGDKVLIKDEDRWQDRAADGVWTYAKNVEVLAEESETVLDAG